MATMSDEASAHRDRILRQAHEMISKKYAAGAEEHGGVLTDHGTDWLVDQAIDEAVDQLTYLLTLKDKLRAAKHKS